MSRLLPVLLGMVVIAACDRSVATDLVPPANLIYRVEPSGDPQAPSGILLSWDAVNSVDLSVYRVYSRPKGQATFDLRASTTSTTFHDTGKPDYEYYVTAAAQNRAESAPSNIIKVDETLRLPAPQALNSVSLNTAVHLSWADNAYASRPAGFRWYRVYSTSLDIDAAPPLCGARWSLEGTTVSPDFLATALTNGVPRCFAVSAESIEGFESAWSASRGDTPRPDARNVVVYTYQADQTRSGFRFWLDNNGDGKVGATELGLVLNGNRTDIDFWIDRDPTTGQVFFVPERAGTTVALYGSSPILDLTSIDIAPTTGFARSGIEAVPGWGYVFQMSGGDPYARYGAVRVTHVSQNYLIFDWSYQTDPGNPELLVGGGLDLYQGGFTVVPK